MHETKCDVCDKIFYDMYDLKIHKFTHIDNVQSVSNPLEENAVLKSYPEINNLTEIENMVLLVAAEDFDEVDPD
jgi:hypothetical protein